MGIAATVLRHRKQNVEEWDDSISDMTMGFCAVLLSMFFFSLGSWFFVIFSIQSEIIIGFYISAFLCLVSIIFLVGYTIVQIGVSMEILSSNKKATD